MARCTDEVHVHLFRGENLSTKENLVVKRTRRRRPAHNPVSILDPVQSVDIELVLDPKET